MISQFQGAVFDHTRAYRFLLWRFWDDRPRVLFNGLNPSTANELEDDPTVKRWTGFAQDWGYGGFYATNLYPFITPDPKELVAPSCYHKANYLSIQMASSLSVLTVACWGDGIKKIPNGKIVAEHVRATYLITPMCFGLTASGNPKHPLYLPSDAELVELVP